MEEDLLAILDSNENEYTPPSNIISLDEQENASNLIVKSPDTILKEYSDYEVQIKNIQNDIDKFKEENKEVFEKLDLLNSNINDLLEKQANLKPELTESMKNAGLKKLENSMLKVTFVEATTRETFDKDKFKNKYPVLFKEFISLSNVKEYIKISEVKKKGK